MEQNLPIITKKIWNLMRVAFYMLKKSMNKKKFLLDLNLFLKRRKFVAAKTLTNLIFHHNHHHNDHHHNVFDNVEEYEFSCTNTPSYRHYFNNKRGRSTHHSQKSVEDLINLWEMMMKVSTTNNKACGSPIVTQSRVTDSPYVSRNESDNNDNYPVMQIDEAAEEFINKFYSQLKQQSN